jgi:hypothetical protein
MSDEFDSLDGIEKAGPWFWFPDYNASLHTPGGLLHCPTGDTYRL